ncbi:hypothetical protein HanRHA438_Chr03g0140981 [Helianthus annuus]|uniref:ABCC10-like N-terminal domain-containing protein n=1 Tax=Helianthus annuus TaxID=4232 RepID=A0A9K3JIX5_HELAN|nr:hypothetical protein HanXRQr2_Chr03g0129451 [Helianthus annuus]KAJ0594370.1 hypothetical protein HanHA300_Chr03g0107821 [Helianthus annuus]KAJ0602531.1 hypothetical protein HanIR_Chr03g0140771 [Helianthus annuus]KAJ0609400.1 hypothetical protein HanHA89_Chr03g0119591 [Helianthus annuus]KAJ0769462.1 hypothetical protein HanLR1_Chr03g0113001 [Helianthus annuus]
MVSVFSVLQRPEPTTVGIWTVVGNLLLVDRWVVVVLQGVVWLLTLYLVSRRLLPKVCSVLILLFYVFLCLPDVLDGSVHRKTTLTCVLNALTFPGVVLFVLCVFMERKPTDGLLYEPLQADTGTDTDIVTPKARAGTLSKLTFWWLNPLMLKGKKESS